MYNDFNFCTQITREHVSVYFYKVNDNVHVRMKNQYFKI